MQIVIGLTFRERMAWLMGLCKAPLRLLLEEADRWVLWLPVGLGAGIGLYFLLPYEPARWAGIALCLPAAGLALLLRHRPWCAALALCAAVVALGFALAQWRAASIAAPVLEKPLHSAWVEGRVAVAETLPGGQRVVLEAVRIEGLPPEKTPARVRIKLFRMQEELWPGQKMRVRARLSRPSPPSLPGTYDFARKFYFERIGAVGYALSRAEAEGTPERSGGLDALRQRISGHVRAAVGEKGAGAVAAALMTGEQAAIPRREMEALRVSGLAHILSVSGLHIGLVVGILYFTVRFLLAAAEPVAIRYPIKKWAAAAAFAGSFLYLGITGFQVPAVRSWLMAALVLAAVVVDRAPSPMRFVAWAAVAILALEPESLLTASFQLSFAATVALVAAYEALRDRRVRRQREDAAPSLPGRLVFWVGGMMLTSLVAGLATGPYALYNFNRVTTYGLLANMLALPMVSFVVMPLAVVAFLLMPFGLSEAALVPMGWALSWVLGVGEWVAALPFSSLPVVQMPLWGIVLATAGGLWLCLWRKPWRLLGLLPLAAGVFSPTFTPLPLLVAHKEAVALYLPGRGLVRLDKGRPNFQTDNWREYFGQERFLKAKEVRDVLRCDVEGCVVPANGKTLAVLFMPSALREECGKADIIVSQRWLGGDCRSSQVAEGRMLWRHGTQLVWADEGGLRLESVSAGDARPWSASNSP